MGMPLNSETEKHVRLSVRLKNISDQDHPRKNTHVQAEKKHGLPQLAYFYRLCVNTSSTLASISASSIWIPFF